MPDAMTGKRRISLFGVVPVTTLCAWAVLAGLAEAADPPGPLPYCVVDTGQSHVFSDRGQMLKPPEAGEPFYGQDAFYQGPQPKYRDNGDGTVTDLNTGLTWQKTPDFENKLTFREALAKAKSFRLAGHADWRLPTVKELYSLIDFNGCVHSKTPVPYIDTRFFEFRYGDERRGERQIDAQYWSSTEYVGLTMRGDATVFGVNFADGRIKGYPRDRMGRRPGAPRRFVRYVLGNRDYGRNRFVDNKDGTVSDVATGLMWARADSGRAMDWQRALAYCEGLELAGHRDWRLPNAKELQSIVDYTRAPDSRDPARRGPAIDPLFRVTDGESWFWTSTTHLDGRILGQRAVYIAFGRATGIMPDRRTGRRRVINVHGAGAQRSDPKSGDPNAPRWAGGFGPQGDEIRIRNYARAVRNIDPNAVRLAAPSTTPIRHVPPPPPRRRIPARRAMAW